MKANWVVVLTIVLLVASPAVAWWHELDTSTRFVFDGSQQSHPKSALVAVPITEPIIGAENSSLSFMATYWTLFRDTDDVRNGKGKVILKIEVVRDDRVIWDRKLKDKVKDDSETTRDCGNCTHKLRACRAFKDPLLPGDLVLFDFSFVGMPDFDALESAAIDTLIGDSCG